MDLLKEMTLHVEALNAAVEADPEFFTSIIHYVRRFKALLTTAKHELTKRELEVVAGKIEEFYRKWRSSGKGIYFPPRQTSDTDSTVQLINSIVATIIKIPDDEFSKIVPARKTDTQDNAEPRDGTERCVFIGHGRSKLWARVKIFLEDEFGLPTVTYESEPRTGESIVPILEKMLDQATFAVLVLTAEDETSQGEKRARQNVVHEAGLFQGRLGFKKAVLLVQEGIQGFTNVEGLQHIPFTGERVEQAFYELRRVLKREKQIR